MPSPKPARTYTTYPATLFEYQIVGNHDKDGEPKIDSFVLRPDLGDTYVVTENALVLEFHNGYHVELNTRHLAWWSKRRFEQKIADPIVGIDVRPAGAGEGNPD